MARWVAVCAALFVMGGAAGAAEVPREKPDVPALACPAPIAAARRFVLVSAPTMASPTATLRLFSREDAGWTAGRATPVTLGRRGLGWAFDQPANGAKPSAIKREGDKRTPAGVFRLSGAFGIGPSDLPGYRDVRADDLVCVDDPKNALYNAIVPWKAAQEADARSFERMKSTRLYRAGLFVDHPTGRAARGGSCIFLHVWRAPGRPTVGCVAMAEGPLRALQAATAGVPSAIAILPEGAHHRLKGCGLPL
ncbi:MAG: hypothetical protein AAF318_10250 [Pseudomonadota bacterium]